MLATCAIACGFGKETDRGSGVTTLYLVDAQNPTGYAQVLAEEVLCWAPNVSYVYGLELVSEGRLIGSLTCFLDKGRDHG